MGLINQLETPVTIAGEWGESVSLTHEAWGMTLQPWSETPLVIYVTRGILRQDGSYKAYPGTEQYAYCSRADLAELLAADPSTGKPADLFRLDDVQALYAAKRAAPPAGQPA